MTPRQRVIGHIRGESVDRLPLMPITMMLASRLIGAKYRDYACDHRVLVEGQIRTAEEFGFDYVSCISDPAREAADCGAPVTFFADAPPSIDDNDVLLKERTDLAKLKMPDVLGGGRMHDRVNAAALFRQRVGGRLLIEGWIEGPCAEAVDLRGMGNFMMDIADDAVFTEGLLDFATELGIAFARAQIEAGVDLMGIGDAAASLVGPELYEQYIWPRQRRLVDEIHRLGCMVRLHICGNTRAILGGMGRLGCEIVDLDYPSPVAEGRAAMGPRQVLLGNVHPVEVMRNGTPQMVRDAIVRCHREAGPRFIVGAGCEIPRDTPDENLRALCRYAHEHRPESS
jgi:MtaA/CmuA family methyltransferase